LRPGEGARPSDGRDVTPQAPACDRCASDQLGLATPAEPAKGRPSKQHGIESRVPWWPDLFVLPGITTADDPPPGGLDALDSYQHQH
jgi:hypothetical protein